MEIRFRNELLLRQDNPDGANECRRQRKNFKTISHFWRAIIRTASLSSFKLRATTGSTNRCERFQLFPEKMIVSVTIQRGAGCELMIENETEPKIIHVLSCALGSTSRRIYNHLLRLLRIYRTRLFESLVRLSKQERGEGELSGCQSPLYSFVVKVSPCQTPWTGMHTVVSFLNIPPKCVPKKHC